MITRLPYPVFDSEPPTVPPQTLRQIKSLLHQARKLLPEPPPLTDREISEIHRRIHGLETFVNNLRVKREREIQKSSRPS